jgi:uncharacterized membrane protein YobD (UPF0266 family)
MLTLILYVIIAAFIVYEIVAHFLMHNRDMKTLSYLILSAESKKFGWIVRVLVICALIALGVHLQGGF